jgi:hypothetical protein
MIFVKHVYFLVSVLEATPNHIPLNYRCLFKSSSLIMHIHSSIEYSISIYMTMDLWWPCNLAIKIVDNNPLYLRNLSIN